MSMRVRSLGGSISRRAAEIGEYIAATHATVREVARAFGVSKSTVHKDVVERLPKVRPQLARIVREVLDLNWGEKHIRGGRATKRKYREAV